MKRGVSQSFVLIRGARVAWGQRGLGTAGFAPGCGASFDLAKDSLFTAHSAHGRIGIRRFAWQAQRSCARSRTLAGVVD